VLVVDEHNSLVLLQKSLTSYTASRSIRCKSYVFVVDAQVVELARYAIASLRSFRATALRRIGAS
jgi:hypothetical protein